MPTVNLISTTEYKVYFSISYKSDYFSTSSEIAKFFNLPIDTYNQLLMDKVIQHNDYKINNGNSFAFYRDIMFELKNVNYKIYIKRFKETFAPQLTLVSLGGD